MLLAGLPGQGQTTHLGPAILHHLEQLPVHVLDLPSLFAVSTKTPEESCAQVGGIYCKVSLCFRYRCKR